MSFPIIIYEGRRTLWATEDIHQQNSSFHLEYSYNFAERNLSWTARILGEQALHANPTPQIRLWCILLNFPRDHVSRKVEEGVVGRKWGFLWLVYLNHNSLEEVPYEAHHIPVSRQPPRCFTEEYALTMTTMLCPQDSPFWSRDHRAIPIESSEINSHPRLPINANQIKWFKTHILFLDFDWCPIEVMLTLHFKWTSIGSLEWIALPSHSSLMKCEAFYLRKGWVERCSFPSWPKLGIIHLAHRVTCWRSLNAKYDRQLYS